MCRETTPRPWCFRGRRARGGVVSAARRGSFEAGLHIAGCARKTVYPIYVIAPGKAAGCGTFALLSWSRDEEGRGQRCASSANFRAPLLRVRLAMFFPILEILPNDGISGVVFQGQETRSRARDCVTRVKMGAMCSAVKPEKILFVDEFAAAGRDGLVW